MIFRRRSLPSLWILGVVLLLFHCGGDDEPTTNAVTQIVDAVCTRIVACNPEVVTQSQCQTAILASDQLDDELGLPEAGEETVQQIADKIDDGTYTVIETSLTACLGEIEALTCSDIEEGYNADSPNDFDNIENFVPEEDEGACDEVVSAS